MALHDQVAVTAENIQTEAVSQPALLLSPQSSPQSLSPSSTTLLPQQQYQQDGHRKMQQQEKVHEEPRPMSLNRRLYRAHASAGRPRPATKELHEAVAFFSKCERLLTQPAPTMGGGNHQKRRRLDLVVDACGGHGLLALLFLVHNKASRAVVIDLFRPPSHDAMLRAWAPFLPPPEAHAVEFVQEDVRTALPRILAAAEKEKNSGSGSGSVSGSGSGGSGGNVGGGGGSAVAVVACHACAHLTGDVIEAAARAGCSVATMSCCHSRKTHGDAIWHAARAHNLNFGAAADMATLGRMQALGMDVRFRQIDAKITPENRILIGLPQTPEARLKQAAAVQAKHDQLKQTYSRAMRQPLQHNKVIRYAVV